MTNIEPADFSTEMLFTFSLFYSLCLIALTEKNRLNDIFSILPPDRASSLIHSTSLYIV